MPKKSNQNLLFEMLRSFTALARTENLSQAVTHIDSTRQTIRRHIDYLEAKKGVKLFEVVDRKYRLTEEGAQSLWDAEMLLLRGDAWLKGVTKTKNGLEEIRTVGDDGKIYFSQQHRLDRLWKDGTDLLQKGFECWSKAKTRIETAEMQPVRKYWTIYRLRPNGWQCVEIGDDSAYAVWFGWEWAKSSVGNMVKDTPSGREHAEFISSSYEKPLQEGGIRLDHLYRVGPRKPGGEFQPFSFQRLLMGCVFPNGDPAVAILANLTNNIDIPWMDKDVYPAMSKEIVKEFEERMDLD